jgi:hypothetical protein
MRNHIQATVPTAPTIPLLDASSLPTAEDWAVVESLTGLGVDFDPDDDRFAGMSVGADSFD